MGARGHSPLGAARAQSPCLSRGQSPGRWTPSRPPMSPLSPRRLLQYQRRASPVVSGARRREMTRSRSLDTVLDSGGPLDTESQFLSRSEDELGCCRGELGAEAADGAECAPDSPLTPPAVEVPPETPTAELTPCRDLERESSVTSETSRDSESSRHGRRAGLVGRTLHKVRHMIAKDK